MISIASYPRHRGTNHLAQLLAEHSAPLCPSGHVMKRQPFATCTIAAGDRPFKERAFTARRYHWHCGECGHFGAMAPFPKEQPA